MDKATIERLIQETLEETQIRNNGSFAVNASGLTLMREAPASALATIEDEVRRLADEAPERLQKGGSMYFLGSYWVIAARMDEVPRAVAFSESMSEATRARMIRSAAAFFNRMPDGAYNQGVAPPDAMIAYFRRCANGESLAVRTDARWAVEQLAA